MATFDVVGPMCWGALGRRPDVVYQDEHVILICARWQDVVGDLPTVDAVITDPPYSERTHIGMRVGPCLNGAGNPMIREGVVYARWSTEDARAAVTLWAERCRGWCAVITDHWLAPVIQAAWEDGGRYAFAPLPFVELGKQPRLTGDGPASWTCWVMTSRPKSRAFAGWGSLPGAYAARSHERRPIKGGKPLWLMRAIVGDYSRPGDLILDPCAGGGTTGVAARLEGRRAILIETDPATAELAAKRLHPLRGKLGNDAQGELFT